MKIIIIGAGPGGYETALLAAERGIETILIESGEVGGTCLNEGCIPTKSLCRSAEMFENIKKSGEFGVNADNVSIDFRRVQERKTQIVGQLRTGVEGLLRNRLVTFVAGKASLVDSHTVSVAPDGTEYSADYIIIATGSSAARLPVEGCGLNGVLTSKEMLDIDAVPERLCVIGAGVIGLEFASVFAAFGSKVTILEYCREILPRFDSDLAKRLRQSLGRRGIEIITQAAVQKIRENPDGSLEVDYLWKEKSETVAADKVLMAVGRKANVEGLNLESAGVEYSAKGIRVDADMRTTSPTVYAIGDVNGMMMLAHAAVFQGKKALDHICGKTDMIDLSVMPSAVFTMPEAASVGLTEDECKEKGIPYICLKSFFRANGKAVCLGETDGFCKIIVGTEGLDSESSGESSGRIIGCHIYGPHSADLVAEMTAVISRHTTLEEFRAIIHSHPTLGEVL